MEHRPARQPQEADRGRQERAAPRPARARRELAHRARSPAWTSRSTRCSGRPASIRTDTIEELFDVAMLLANQPVPRGQPRRDPHQRGRARRSWRPTRARATVCACRRSRPRASDALRAFLPAEASVRNPVDMIASARAPAYERAPSRAPRRPGVDAVHRAVRAAGRHRGGRRRRGDPARRARARRSRS